MHNSLFGVSTGARRSGLSLWGRIFSTSQLAHEGVSAEVVKVDASNICIIKSTSTTGTLLFASTGAIEVVITASMGTTASGARKGRALELSSLVLATESLQQTGGRFGGEFVAAETDTDGTASDFEAVHVGECCLRVSRINVSRTDQYGQGGRWNAQNNLLHKTVTFAATVFLLLRLDELELTEWRKNVAEVFLGDRKMYVTNI